MFRNLLTATTTIALVLASQSAPVSAGSRSSGIGVGIAAGVVGALVGAAIANQGARAQPRSESRSTARTRSSKSSNDDSDEPQFASHRGNTVMVSNVGPDPFASYVRRPDANAGLNRQRRVTHCDDAPAPRTRGAEPVTSPLVTRCFSCSPHTRG